VNNLPRSVNAIITAFNIHTERCLRPSLFLLTILIQMPMECSLLHPFHERRCQTRGPFFATSPGNRCSSGDGRRAKPTRWHSSILSPRSFGRSRERYDEIDDCSSRLGGSHRSECAVQLDAFAQNRELVGRASVITKEIVGIHAERLR
jgi:hypothetical protein